MRRFGFTSIAAALILGAIALLAAAVFMLPELLVDAGELEDKTGDALKQEEQVLKARNDARVTGIQAVGVLALVVGSLITWRTVRLTREGQLTDRYAKAIEGLDKSKPMGVQLGAIHALERIAWDSRRDHGPVMEVLVGHLRDVADPHDPDHPATGAYTVPVPVQTIATVLARRRASWDPKGSRLRLEGLDLRNVRLTGADLRRANLSDSNLSGAFLERCCLDSAAMLRTIARGAHLEDATARKQADLRWADFDGARLARVDFRGAIYGSTRFRKVTASDARGLPPFVSRS